MTFPFRPPTVPLKAWQKEFRGALVERIWMPAAHLLAMHEVTEATMTSINQFPALLAAFISEAPDSIIKMSGLPDSNEPHPEWRAESIGRLIVSQFVRAQAALEAKDIALVHHHLTAIADLRPRTTGQEMVLTSIMTEAAAVVGECEQRLAEARPDLETNPSIAAPSAQDYRHTVATGYDPLWLPDLLEQAIESGASNELIDLGVRAAAVHLHWPGWRALTKVSSRTRYVLRYSAKQVLLAGMDLSPGARAHLQAFVTGNNFPELPPINDDDVPF